MAGQGGHSGNEQAAAYVQIDARGNIGISGLREQWVWGLGREQPLCGTAEPCQGDTTCTVVGFRKSAAPER